MAKRKGASSSKSPEKDKEKEKKRLEDDAKSSSTQPHASAETSPRSVQSNESQKVIGMDIDSIAAKYSALRPKSSNILPSDYTSAAPLPVPQPLSVVKKSVGALSSSPSSGNIAKSELITSPPGQEPIEVQESESSRLKHSTSGSKDTSSADVLSIHKSFPPKTKTEHREPSYSGQPEISPRVDESPKSASTTSLSASLLDISPDKKLEVPGHIEPELKTTKLIEGSSSSNDERQHVGSTSDQSSSPAPSVSRFETPVQARHGRLSPLTPYTDSTAVHYPSSPSLRFIEEVPESDSHWEADDSLVGTQGSGPNIVQNNAHVLGDRPPIKLGTSKAEIEARARFVANRTKKETVAGSQQATEVGEDIRQLRTKVKALKKAGMQQMPEAMHQWKAFVDSYSRGDTQDLTVEAAVNLGNEVLETAHQLGTVQSSEVIVLRHENDIIKKELSLLRKDLGINSDYPSPDKLEEMKRRWEKETKIIKSNLEKAESRLEDVESVAKQEVRKLEKELEKSRIENNSLKGDISVFKDQIVALRNSEGVEKSKAVALESIKNQTGQWKFESDNEEARLRRKVIKLEKDAEDRSERLKYLVDKISKLEPIDPTSDQGSTSNKSGPQLSSVAKAVRGSKIELPDAHEVAMLRIRLGLNNLVLRRAQNGSQPDDAAEIVNVALDALKLCEEQYDETAVIRVSFWLAIALYYNDDVKQAHIYFQKAKIPEALPEYEATCLPGWLERCTDGIPDKGSAHNEASQSQAT